MIDSKSNITVHRRGKSPDPVDVHVGSRLRLRRHMMGLSQEQLGKASGLTFQQIQKYERGINRMGASRLFQISRILSVPVAWFFEEIMPTAPSAMGFAESGQDKIEIDHSNDNDWMQRRESLELIRTYWRISESRQRHGVLDLVRSLAGKSDKK